MSLNNLLNRNYIENQYIIKKIELGDVYKYNFGGIILSKKFLDEDSERYLMLNILNRHINVFFLDDWLEII